MTNKVMIIGSEDKANQINKAIKENHLYMKVVDFWEYTPRDNNDKDKQQELLQVLPMVIKDKKVQIVIFASDEVLGGYFTDIIPKYVEQYEFFELEKHIIPVFNDKKNVMLFGSKDKFQQIENLINENPNLKMQVIDHWEYNPDDKSQYTIDEISYELPNELNYLKIDVVIFTSDDKDDFKIGSPIHLWIKRYGLKDFTKFVQRKKPLLKRIQKIIRRAG